MYTLGYTLISGVFHSFPGAGMYADSWFEGVTDILTSSGVYVRHIGYNYIGER